MAVTENRTSVSWQQRVPAGYPKGTGVVLLAAAILAGSAVGAQQPGAQTPPDTTRGTIHVVGRGDTLWDLSARYLNNPWVWPVIWRLNQQAISDPHWIYPGQKLLLPVGGGPPVVLSFEEVWPGPQTETTETARQAQQVPLPIPPGETPPGAGGTPPPRAAAAATPEGPQVRVIGQGAGTSRLYPLASVGAVLAAGYIGNPADWPPGRIIDAPNRQQNLSLYDLIFLDVGDGRAAPGDLYLVVEAGNRVRHPEWGHQMGRQIKVKGVVRIEDVEGRTSQASVTSVYAAVRVKDRVIPAFPVDSRPWKSFVPIQGGREGFVVAKAKPEGNLYPYDMIFIDGGTEDNVQVGDLYVIRRPEQERGRLRFFQDELARAVVIAVQSKTATLMLLSLKDPSIGLGERVQLIGRSVFGEAEETVPPAP
jgi:hypothetical protein